MRMYPYYRGTMGGLLAGAVALLAVTGPALARKKPKNDVEITVEGDYRYIVANGIPDHPTGLFPNKGNPNEIRPQEYRFRVPLAPQKAAQPMALGRVPFGVALNGVVFDPATDEFYRGDLDWQYEALSGAVDLGLDVEKAHVQPSGAYHYHGIPDALEKRVGDGHSALVGYAADGFPIYVRYGYADPQHPEAAVREMRSSWRLRRGKRPGGPGGYFDGTFVQDYEYVAGSGDLDECNGRETPTPDYPDGTYAYFLTRGFPGIPRCLVGTPDASFLNRPAPPGGPHPPGTPPPHP